MEDEEIKLPKWMRPDFESLARHIKMSNDEKYKLRIKYGMKY